MQATGTPAKPPTKPTPLVSVPLADPSPIPFPLEETARGISDGVVRTLEGHLQTTLKDILPAAMREALKAKSAARTTREVQRLRGELIVAKSQVKTAEKQAQEVEETMDDDKRQKLVVDGELKHMREKWEEEKERSNKYLPVFQKQK